MASIPIGITLYNGPSRIDGAPIVAIATGIGRQTKNRKTGSAVQIWILRSDIDPVQAMQTGADVSICGNCRHRSPRTCYVNVIQAPLAIWRAYKRGAYADYDSATHRHLFSGRVIRLGAYGDPAAVPMPVWRSIERTKPMRVIGYTHQWKQPRFRHIGRYCMASVDTPRERFEARAMGWRTFRIRLPEERIGTGEIICPASDEHTGNKITCEQCQICAGNLRSGKADVAIVVHGRKGVTTSYRNGRTDLITLSIGDPIAPQTDHARSTLALWNALAS